ncbi:hypothetical protein [Burkholderia dolosa]|uniref:hypothetical protein n=1 Tax=Burkholderia dolosa TaxID=152500 RepID=UPI001B9E16F0|nr:hypothetical protein [Burkholderia dolosa]MBR8059474.1 hypothetical protein [Burkholderia dolosa]
MAIPKKIVKYSLTVAAQVMAIILINRIFISAFGENNDLKPFFLWISIAAVCFSTQIILSFFSKIINGK